MFKVITLFVILFSNFAFAQTNYNYLEEIQKNSLETQRLTNEILRAKSEAMYNQGGLGELDYQLIIIILVLLIVYLVIRLKLLSRKLKVSQP